MGRQGKPMTKEEGEKVVEYLEVGITPNAISKRLHRSSHCIYTYIRNNNLSEKVCPFRPKGRVIDADRIEYKNISELPDTILFKQINWAIPILVILLFSSCYPARDPSTGKFWKSGKVLQRMTARNYNHCNIYYDHFDNPIPFK